MTHAEWRRLLKNCEYKTWDAGCRTRGNLLCAYGGMYYHRCTYRQCPKVHGREDKP